MNRPRVLYSLPLRTALPGLVLITFTLLLVAMVFYEYRQLTGIIRETAISDAQNEMARLQRAVASAFSRHDRVAVEREITGYGVRNDLEALALVGPDGNILYATRFAWKGRPASQVLPGWESHAAARAISRHESLFLNTANDSRLTVYVPLRIDAEDAAGTPRTGLLYRQQTLQSRFDSIWRVVLNEAVYLWWAGLLAMAMLLYVLQRYVALPTRRLAEAAPLLAQGSAAAEVEVIGRGELSELGHAFNSASRTVRSTLASLRDREAKYRTIVENAGQGIMLIDTSLNLLEHNREFDRWFPDVAGATRCFQLLGNTAPCPFCQAVSGMADGITRETFTTLESRREKRHFRIVSSPVRDGDGKVSACVEILEDITERLTAERELARMSRALRALSACNGAVVRATEEEALLSEVCRVIVAEAGYRMAWIGVPQDDAEKSVIPVAHAGVDTEYLSESRFSWDADTDVGRGPVGTSIRERRAVVVTSVLSDPRFGPWREAARTHGFGSVLSLPLLAEDGIYGALTVYAVEPHAFERDEKALLSELAETLAYGIASLRNRTALRESEEGLRRLNAELEERIAARTAQLQRANEELEAFSYSVSHDLRAPLRSIDGFGQLLQRRYAEAIDATGKDYLNRICRAAGRMGQLIDDLLALSRINRCELDFESVDLSELAERTVRELQAASPQRRVETVIAAGLIVEADRRLMQVVINNLIGNAWKYTGRTEQARIEVGCRDDSAGAFFFVRDNGAGFEMAYADKLFEPFRRLHREDEFEGNGIGLATVQRILARHGGTIWAESAPGEGATFYFRLGRPALSPAGHGAGESDRRSAQSTAGG